MAIGCPRSYLFLLRNCYLYEGLGVPTTHTLKRRDNAHVGLQVALNMAGVVLARDLKSRGICVALIHPGVVRGLENFAFHSIREPMICTKNLLKNCPVVFPEAFKTCQAADRKRRTEGKRGKA